MLIHEAEEVSRGREQASVLEEAFGLYPDDALADYVQRIGLAAARSSERPELPWEFRVLDTPDVNAFALPGGLVYVTRGLLAYVDSEAALAGILGHQVAHVGARHTSEGGANAGVPAPASSPPEPLADRFAPVPAALPAFTAEEETEADRLGALYALRQGYDADPLASLLGRLDRVPASPAGLLPAWQSTHPDPAERQAAVRAFAAESPPPPGVELTVDREAYGRAVDGLVFGEDPRQGYALGARFLHPGLAFELAFPEDFRIRRARGVVHGAAPDGSASFRLTVASVPETTSAEEHAREFFRSHRLESGTGERLHAGPYPAYRAPFRAQTPRGALVGEAGFVKDGARVYEIVGLSVERDFRRRSPQFVRSIRSFDRLRDRRALEARPLVLSVREAPGGTTLGRILTDADVAPERFREAALLNDRGLGEIVPRGDLVKILRPGVP